MAKGKAKPISVTTREIKKADGSRRVIVTEKNPENGAVISVTKREIKKAGGSRRVIVTEKNPENGAVQSNTINGRTIVPKEDAPLWTVKILDSIFQQNERILKQLSETNYYIYCLSCGKTPKLEDVARETNS